MGLSVFSDRAKLPQDEDLAEVLGEAKALWDQLKDHVKDLFPDIIEDWKHYGKNSGWTMKLLKKKRNLFFTYPGMGQFVVVFVFGDKAVAVVNESSLPKHIKDALNEARKYAEGRGIQVMVKNPADLEIVKQLITIKVAN